ncbi:MAG: hypothetical protein PVG39_25865 [Desulfobacteraceae bacterium]|jgi:hypothetical protein
MDWQFTVVLIVIILVVFTIYKQHKYSQELHKDLHGRINELAEFTRYFTTELGYIGERQERRPGSGNVAYKLNGALIEFNEYPQYFKGFTIDYKGVQIYEVVARIERAKRAKEQTKMNWW